MAVLKVDFDYWLKFLRVLNLGQHYNLKKIEYKVIEILTLILFQYLLNGSSCWLSLEIVGKLFVIFKLHTKIIFIKSKIWSFLTMSTQSI